VRVCAVDSCIVSVVLLGFAVEWSLHVKRNWESRGLSYARSVNFYVKNVKVCL